MSKLTALITGASGGIGFELAKIHAKNACDLVLVARNAEKLNQIKHTFEKEFGIKVHVFATDLSIHSNILLLQEFTDSQNIRVNHLINNAGIGVFGQLSETNIDAHLKLMALNVNALFSLTHIYSKKMKSYGSGRVLNIASTAAFMPGPYMSTYFASKAFVLSFGEAVNSELEGTGVSITTLCPGPTHTGFESAADGMVNSGLFSKQKVATASEVAENGYKSMMKSQPMLVSGVLNKLSVFFIRFTPRFMVTALTKNIMKPMH